MFRIYLKYIVDGINVNNSSSAVKHLSGIVCAVFAL